MTRDARTYIYIRAYLYLSRRTNDAAAPTTPGPADAEEKDKDDAKMSARWRSARGHVSGSGNYLLGSTFLAGRTGRARRDTARGAVAGG